jgi:hypothetical protein
MINRKKTHDKEKIIDAITTELQHMGYGDV